MIGYWRNKLLENIKMVDGTDEMKLVASYGKQNVPVFKVYRDKDNEEMHHVIDMLVNVTLSGEV